MNEYNKIKTWKPVIENVMNDDYLLILCSKYAYYFTTNYSDSNLLQLNLKLLTKLDLKNVYVDFNDSIEPDIHRIKYDIPFKYNIDNIEHYIITNISNYINNELIMNNYNVFIIKQLISNFEVSETSVTVYLKYHMGDEIKNKK